MVSPTDAGCSSAELASPDKDGARSTDRANAKEDHQPEGQEYETHEKAGNGQRSHRVIKRTIALKASGSRAPYQQGPTQRTEDSGRDTQAKCAKADSSRRWPTEADGGPEKVQANRDGDSGLEEETQRPERGLTRHVLGIEEEVKSADGDARENCEGQCNSGPVRRTLRGQHFKPSVLFDYQRACESHDSVKAREDESENARQRWIGPKGRWDVPYRPPKASSHKNLDACPGEERNDECQRKQGDASSCPILHREVPPQSTARILERLPAS